MAIRQQSDLEFNKNLVHLSLACERRRISGGRLETTAGNTSAFAG